MLEIFAGISLEIFPELFPKFLWQFLKEFFFPGFTSGAYTGIPLRTLLVFATGFFFLGFH